MLNEGAAGREGVVAVIDSLAGAPFPSVDEESAQ